MALCWQILDTLLYDASVEALSNIHTYKTNRGDEYVFSLFINIYCFKMRSLYVVDQEWKL